MDNSRILVVGATGRLGQHLVKASIASGHPTFALLRESSLSIPVKSALVQTFVSAGVKVFYKKMVSLIHYLVVQRFIPAEFGVDPEKVHFPDPAGNFYIRKAHNRHVIKKEGIPHTFVSCNYFAGFLLPQLAQPDLKAPPRDNIMIFGDGNRKAVFVKEEDVATFTIKAVDDPRTLNKVMYMRPPGNMYSLNELVELWEKKVGKSLEKFYIPEEQVLQSIQENPFPNNLFMLFVCSTFVRGDHTNFEIIPSDVESTQLYPDVKYTTIDEYLDGLLYLFFMYPHDLCFMFCSSICKNPIQGKEDLR
ncbi:hypothetical protein AMTRI_Chr03g143550 [Amborella trichopoda]